MDIKRKDMDPDPAPFYTPPSGVPETLPPSLSCESGYTAAITLTGLMCCGLKELSGLVHYRLVADSRGVLRWRPDSCLEWDLKRCLHDGYFNGKGAYFILTQVRGDCYIQRVEGLIKARGLGELTLVGERRNTNSGNRIEVYLWAPDYSALKGWVGGWSKNAPTQLQ